MTGIKKYSPWVILWITRSVSRARPKGWQKTWYREKRPPGFGLVLAAGIAILAVDLTVGKGQRVFLMLGIFAVLCGIVGIISSWTEAAKHSEALRKMGEKEALREAAWEELKAHAPAKDKEIDLTYIPVDQTTMKRKNGDLMVLYDLLPEIAIQAYDKIHREYSMNR